MLSLRVFNAVLPRQSVFAPKNSPPDDIHVECVVKCCGEVLLTQTSNEGYEPAWCNEPVFFEWRKLNGLINKENSNRRPFYFEYLDLEIYEISPTVRDKKVKIYETRIPFSVLGDLQTFPLLKVGSSRENINDSSISSNTNSSLGSNTNSNDEYDNARVVVLLKSEDNQLSKNFFDLKPTTLTSILPHNSLRYRHLFIKDNWSPGDLTYHGGMPCPPEGEIIIDFYDQVEWLIPGSTNAFGDKITNQVIGSLILTDLRLIFLPNEVSLPIDAPASYNSGDFIKLSEEFLISNPELLVLLHRLTVQVPIPSIKHAKGYNISEYKSILKLELLDFTILEFHILKNTVEDSSDWYLNLSDILEQFYLSNISSFKQFINFDFDTENNILNLKTRVALDDNNSRGSFSSIHSSSITSNNRILLYLLGLDTKLVEPKVILNRFIDYISYEIRTDLVYTRWCKYLYNYVKSKNLQSNGFKNEIYFYSHSNTKLAENLLNEDNLNSSSKKSVRVNSFLLEETNNNSLLEQIKALTKLVLKNSFDWNRQIAQSSVWSIRNINESYKICPSYPSQLLLPHGLSDEDLTAAATQRSIGRIPSICWIHPVTKVPLCRSSQPLAGVSGLISLEADKKLLLTLKYLSNSTSSTNNNLRIADARPKLNANANAVQGKGFENIGFLGGPSVAQLVFLDIENIHVVRNSFVKVKDGFLDPWALTVSSNPSNQNPSTSNDDNNEFSWGSVIGLSSNSPSNPNSSTFSSITSTFTNTSSNNTNYMSTNPNNTGLDHSSILTQYYSNSKWNYHITSLLRGAISIADSLTLGHPFLVHCSDGWDRTSQLSSLSCLLLDPYYRTIEGFLCLIQREWISYGHKFEDRVGRGSGSHGLRETSPVFIQFLDCVNQVLKQFPCSFEFTSYFLELLVQCLYSGLLFSFRGNNERERNLLELKISNFQTDQSYDTLFGTLPGYIFSLLLINSTSRQLYINPNYTPPPGFLTSISTFTNNTENGTNFVQNNPFLPLKPNHTVHYIRPKVSILEVNLWQEGLFGLNSNLLSLTSSLNYNPSLSFNEINSINMDYNLRYFSTINNFIKNKIIEENKKQTQEEDKNDDLKQLNLLLSKLKYFDTYPINLLSPSNSSFDFTPINLLISQNSSSNAISVNSSSYSSSSIFASSPLLYNGYQLNKQKVNKNNPIIQYLYNEKVNKSLLDSSSLLYTYYKENTCTPESAYLDAERNTAQLIGKLNNFLTSVIIAKRAIKKLGVQADNLLKVKSLKSLIILCYSSKKNYYLELIINDLLTNFSFYAKQKDLVGTLEHFHHSSWLKENYYNENESFVSNLGSGGVGSNNNASNNFSINLKNNFLTLFYILFDEKNSFYCNNFNLIPSTPIVNATAPTLTSTSSASSSPIPTTSTSFSSTSSSSKFTKYLFKSYKEEETNISTDNNISPVSSPINTSSKSFMTRFLGTKSR